jgi:hypothetical protein
MAARKHTGAARYRARSNQVRTHPKRALQPTPRDRNASPAEAPESDPLERLSKAIALVETVATAMQTREDDPDLGPICACLEIACCQLRRAHGAVDLALGEVKE